VTVCDICREPVTDGLGAYDENESFWCVACMLRWEREHGRHWEDGAPMPTPRKS